MKKYAIVVLVILAAIAPGYAQKFFTKTGEISFYSEAPLEKIEAHNKQVAAIMDMEKQSLAFKVLIKSFEFEKSLMQEHFNENYMESDKFPNATFEGKIDELASLDLKKDGVHNVTATGKLTIHGVTKEVKIPGKLTVKDGGKKLSLVADFMVKLSDYEIKNDKVKNISEDIQVKVNADLAPLQK